MSIAQNIIEIVKNNVPYNEQDSVKTIKMKIGSLAGVVPDSLKFCFEVISNNGPFAGASLNIENIPCIMNCKDCTKTFQSEYGICFCPTCGNKNTEIISGTELVVSEIELAD